MAQLTSKIESIFAGEGAVEYFPMAGQFLASYAVDPDFPKDDSSVRPCGLIRPTAMAKFSASEITGVPLWIVTNPKTSDTYVYTSDGKVHLVDSSLAMGTALNSGNALTTASGNGAAYYDNYLYVATNTDITRYGPLNGTPSLNQNYWVTTLSKTALTNTTYPTVRGITLPNHVMHRHTDNKLYFTDVVGNQGVLHYIKTTKTTVEGDTNDGSTYNALDFPYGYYPTCIASYGTDLVVALVEGTNATIKQAPAKIAFWNTTDSSFSKIVDLEFSDPLITAIKNVNGDLFVFSGNASGGTRVLQYVGGYKFQEIASVEDSVPPFQGAVDFDGGRIIWGSSATDPESVAVVRSIGSKKAGVQMGLQTPFKATSSGSSGWVSALKYIEHASHAKRRPIIGWSDGSAKGLDKISTTYGTWLIRLGYKRIGQPFQIKKITIPLAQAIAANMTITPKLYYDDGSTSETLTTINNTNFPNSERQVVLYPQQKGDNNVFLELKGSGTALLTVGLPIELVIETLDN